MPVEDHDEVSQDFEIPGTKFPVFAFTAHSRVKHEISAA